MRLEPSIMYKFGDLSKLANTAYVSNSCNSFKKAPQFIASCIQLVASQNHRPFQLPGGHFFASEPTDISQILVSVKHTAICYKQVFFLYALRNNWLPDPPSLRMLLNSTKNLHIFDISLVGQILSPSEAIERKNDHADILENLRKPYSIPQSPLVLQ